LVELDQFGRAWPSFSRRDNLPKSFLFLMSLSFPPPFFLFLHLLSRRPTSSPACRSPVVYLIVHLRARSPRLLEYLFSPPALFYTSPSTSLPLLSLSTPDLPVIFRAFRPGPLNIRFCLSPAQMRCISGFPSRAETSSHSRYLRIVGTTLCSFGCNGPSISSVVPFASLAAPTVALLPL